MGVFVQDSTFAADTRNYFKTVRTRVTRSRILLRVNWQAFSCKFVSTKDPNFHLFLLCWNYRHRHAVVGMGAFEPRHERALFFRVPGSAQWWMGIGFMFCSYLCWSCLVFGQSLRQYLGLFNFDITFARKSQSKRLCIQQVNLQVPCWSKLNISGKCVYPLPRPLHSYTINNPMYVCVICRRVCATKPKAMRGTSVP